MKDITKGRKQAKRYLECMMREGLGFKVIEVIEQGKRAFDRYAMELGRMLAEAIMYMEREEMAGPDYSPKDPGIRKWASQAGSVYIGGSKVKVERPRVRGIDKEMRLKSYQSLNDPEQFSEELLVKVLRGMSGRKYKETLTEAAGVFGISAGSISNRIIEATIRKVKEFLERNLSGIKLFCVLIDTIHRGGSAFIVGMGIDMHGKKWNLGFWEGATENHEICQLLLGDLERRGLRLSREVMFITDGGGGVIKALKERYGKGVIHQRCVIHKDRNIQKHLAKKYRDEAHKRYWRAIEQNNYEDAKTELLRLERWLRKINESAADSLLEALEDILTCHRLQVNMHLRKVLYSTNPIEAVFSQVRKAEGNIKRYRGSRMSRRWLASCLLFAEQQFRKIKGYQDIPEVIRNIRKEQRAVGVAA